MGLGAAGPFGEVMQRGWSRGCPLRTGQAAGCQSWFKSSGWPWVSCVALASSLTSGRLSCSRPPELLAPHWFALYRFSCTLTCQAVCPHCTPQWIPARFGHGELPFQGACRGVCVLAPSPSRQAAAPLSIRSGQGPRGLPEARPAPLLAVSALIQGHLFTSICLPSGSAGSSWLILCPDAWYTAGAQ